MNRQAGVSDMTLLSTISNDSINDNLQKRFENADIYVTSLSAQQIVAYMRLIDIYRTCVDIRQSIPSTS